jgi:hypothetical protein
VIRRGCHRLHQLRRWRLHSTSGICEGLYLLGILLVALLYIARARVLAACCWLLGLLSLWCRTTVEATGRFRRMVVEGVWAMELAFAGKVEVAVGGG